MLSLERVAGGEVAIDDHVPERAGEAARVRGARFKQILYTLRRPRGCCYVWRGATPG